MYKTEWDKLNYLKYRYSFSRMYSPFSEKWKREKGENSANVETKMSEIKMCKRYKVKSTIRNKRFVSYEHEIEK